MSPFVATWLFFTSVTLPLQCCQLDNYHFSVRVPSCLEFGVVFLRFVISDPDAFYDSKVTWPPCNFYKQVVMWLLFGSCVKKNLLKTTRFCDTTTDVIMEVTFWWHCWQITITNMFLSLSAWSRSWIKSGRSD